MTFLETLVAGPYSIALIAAVVVGIFLAIRAGNKAGFSSLAWRVLLVAAITGGFIGSKFIFLDFHAPQLGEKSNLGGLIAGIAVVVLLAKWLRMGALRALDAMALPTLVGMTMGRVGCFLAGCCSGTHTTLPWGVHVDGDAVAIHPVQLYEAFADLLLVGALAKWIPASRPGNRVGIAVVSYAGIRFATEFVRDGRTSVAGLNPVQWSMLAIGIAVASWLWQRRSNDKIDSGYTQARTGDLFLHTERRAFNAAIGLMVAMMLITLGIPSAFLPFEAAFLMTAACGIAGYAALCHPPRWLARPLLPSLGALFLLDAPADSVERKSEVIVGGGFWGGRYSTIVGERFTENYGCGAGVVPTYARRNSTAGWFSAGVRSRTTSGARVTVEGKMLAGKDKLLALAEGPVSAPVSKSTSIMAGGAALTVEGQNHHLLLNVLGGEMSNAGTESRGVTGSVTARIGVEKGLFIEAHLAQPQWYATTGDLAYAGLGYVFNPKGARAVLGVGAGAHLGVHVPVRGFEIDIVGRAPSHMSKIESPTGTVSIGVKRAFNLR